MQLTFKSLLFVSILVAVNPVGSKAGEADVLKVSVVETAAGIYSFHVTVRHDDTGWKHYANGWEVLDLDDNILGKRVLLHPHVNEQPFKRSLSGVKIPKSIVKVVVRAHDLVHGLGGSVKTVMLPR